MSFDRLPPLLVRCVAAMTLAALTVVNAAVAQPARRGDGYPKLFGMNIGAKNYDSPEYQAALSRLDVVILAFYPGWKKDRDGSEMRRVVQSLKRLNPSIASGQYTVLIEAGEDGKDGKANSDRADKLSREDWWLRRTDGSKVQWTPRYGNWDVNITDWTRADASGERYPQWLAKRDAGLFFDRVPDFDIWYFDNVMQRSRAPAANWKLDGVDRKGDDPEVAAAFRRGMATHWQTARRLYPDKLLIGNADNDLSSPEFRGLLNGAFLEALMGKSWSLEKRGWRTMMERYLAVRANLRAPAIVAFNVWGAADDYAFFRYAFASCLLGDGYFSFTDEKRSYGMFPWFDEYDVRIGKALEPSPDSPWSNGVYRRRYEHAMVLVNPDAEERSVTVEEGWKRLSGTQAPSVNDGSAARVVVLPPRGGLLLVKR